MLKKIMRVLFVLLIAAFTFLFFKLHLNRYLTNDNITATRDYMIVHFGAFLPVIIIVLYILFNLVGFPTMYFSILMGYLYGLPVGLLIAWIGMTVGIVASFINSRYLFRELFLRKFGEKDIVKKLEAYLAKHRLVTIVMTRVFFIIPYNAQNYAYGLTSVDPLVYIIGTAIGILPITIMNVMIGQLLYKGDIMNASIPKIMAVVSVILVVVLVIFITKKIFFKKENKAE